MRPVQVCHVAMYPGGMGAVVIMVTVTQVYPADCEPRILRWLRVKEVGWGRAREVALSGLCSSKREPKMFLGLLASAS